MVPPYDLLTLLGTDENDEPYSCLLKRFGGHTDVYSVCSITTRTFANHGFSIDYSLLKSRFCGLCYHFNTESVRGQSITKYAGALPFGIHENDSRIAVTNKLGVAPYFSSNALDPLNSERDFLNKYEIQQFRLYVNFETEGGPINLIGVFDSSCY